jgi:hypothetical protein
MRKLSYILFLLAAFIGEAQELNCSVVVNSDQIGQTNQQIFKTLERAVNDFVNKTKWTDKQYAPAERIRCNMFISVTAYENNRFTATLQVQASRPVFNSSFLTPIFNFNDKNFSFNYQEFQPLVYNPNAFDSNLVSMLSYYVYTILGMDADSFAPNSGRGYFSQAQQIVNQSQQSGFAGWNQADGLKTRFSLSDDLQSNTYREFHQVMYEYHRLGLDKMSEDTRASKIKIANTLNLLALMNNRRPNSFLVQTFFDTKSDEILSIFSGGPQVDITQTVETLNKIAPFYAAKWQGIKF